jgi:glycosyltransferase involved in cell wall biosynthesis
MRILYHHRTQGEEPESVHILSMVKAFQDLGHEVRVVGPSRKDLRAAGPNAGLLSRLKRALPGAAFELAQIGYNAVTYLKLRRELREWRPDLVYERYALYHSAGVTAARHARVPLILEVNTPYAYAWARYYRLRFVRLAEALERRILRRAGAVVTVTEAQRRFLEEKRLGGADITVTHNAVDPAIFDPGAYPGARAAAGLDDDALVVGFVGTMNRWQSMPVLLPVMRAVLSARREAAFLLVGDGEHRADLEEACRREGLLGRVRFTGRKAHAQVPPLVAAMDIAVLPDSNGYGSPMKLFEYLAMGKAVVAPRVGPVEEVVRDGETGLLIDGGNAEQLAERVLRLASDPELRRRLGAQGRAEVLARHTWRRNAETVLAIHRRLAGQTA